MKDYKEKYTTIFLTDSAKPKSMLLLKRASTKKFAPNLWTGLGGAFEMGEDSGACARRELLEEAGIENIELKEFARMVVNGEKIICQFVGEYNRVAPACTEGELFWVPVLKIFGKELIPTARLFLDEWARRGFSSKNTFSLFVDLEETSGENIKIEKVKVVDGLLD